MKHSLESIYCRNPKCEPLELCLQVRELELILVLSKLLSTGWVPNTISCPGVWALSVLDIKVDSKRRSASP